jgi:hypothetical protein
MISTSATGQEPVVTKSAILEKASAIIRPSDAADLRWFRKCGGMGVFQPSPTAALMQRLEMYAKTARPCENCGGDPVKWNAGYGFVASTRSKGRKPAAYELLQLLELDADGLLPPEPDLLCPKCSGRGWVVRGSRSRATTSVTVRSTGSSKKGGGSGVAIQDSDIARLGLVSRRLSAVSDVAPVARAALEAYHDPDGGDAVALWFLVPAGKTMLRGNSQKLHPLAFFANLRAEQAAKPSPKRQAQFEAAQKQATELFEASCRVWNSVVERPVGAPFLGSSAQLPIVDVVDSSGDE